MFPIRVLLADDHPVVMNGVATALASFGVRTIGQVSSPHAVLEHYKLQRPDVLVLDIRFGTRQTGLDLARTIFEHDKDAKIIFFSQFDQDALIRQCYKLGASAFVTKNVPPKMLAEAIHQVHEGTSYFLPDVATRLAALAIHGTDSPREVLKEREMEVFIHLAHGATAEEISSKMSISKKMVSNYCQSIKGKLGIERPAEFTKLAVKHGLIEP